MTSSELTKIQLHELADAMLLGATGAKEEAIRFFEQDTTGTWHNRARAMIARRLKNLPITEAEKTRLVEVVKARLTSGIISEQFRDQLRLALFLDRPAVIDCAKSCLTSEKAHVVRFSKWTLEHKETEPNKASEPTATNPPPSATPPAPLAHL